MANNPTYFKPIDEYNFSCREEDEIKQYLIQVAEKIRFDKEAALFILQLRHKLKVSVWYF
jgi:hypothetical protein